MQARYFLRIIWLMTQWMAAVLLAAIGLTSCGNTQSPEHSNPIVLPKFVGECAPGQPVLTTSAVVPDTGAKQYFQLPFTVDSATQRVEVGYGWVDQASAPNPNPLDSTTFDLGLWDEQGFRNVAGFRGWSGSRQGRLDQGQERVWVEAGSAERGYLPGTIIGGEWSVEIGVGAVKTGGSEFYVEIECLAAASQGQRVIDPVASDFTGAQQNPPYAGWMHADFHMHAFHSNSDAPVVQDMLQASRSVGLDVLMYTEYVTPQHWDELGQVQANNPDVLIYPGREIITYFGHVNTFGETPNVLEYRQGFEDVDMRMIQAQSVADGALVQVNHPTTFAGPLFEDLCRGCAYELDSNTDFSLVDAIEVQNSAVETTAANVGINGPPGAIENPFTASAIDYWEEKLLAGFKITATSGSDAKGTEALVPGRSGYGLSATALCAPSDGSLSRAGVDAAIAAGCAFIKTYGVLHSPHVDMQVSNGSASVTYGGSLPVAAPDTASMTLQIENAAGQLLVMVQNGNEVPTPMTCNSVPMTSPAVLATDNETCVVTVTRAASGDGPLGTFWRFDIKRRDPANTVAPVDIRTVIANPVFLTD